MTEPDPTPGPLDDLTETVELLVREIHAAALAERMRARAKAAGVAGVNGMVGHVIGRVPPWSTHQVGR